MDNTSYAVGMILGRQLLSLGGESLDVESLSLAIGDMLAHRGPRLSESEAQRLVQAFAREGEERKNRAAAEKGRLAKEEGEAFLRDNKLKDGVLTTASGLQYTPLQEGTGRAPKAADKVRCHYEGRTLDGHVFDSSYRRGEPATFPLQGVIRGWTEGLQLMKEGGKTRFFIPQDLAYGARGAGDDIPPFATLIFDVELLEVM